MKYEVIDKIATLAAVAFGLIVALAWNQAIVALFTSVLTPTMGIPVLIGYALIITVIAVVITIWLGRMSQRAKSETEAAERSEKGQKAA